MFKWIVCLLLGHEYKETSEYVGKLDNGLAKYKIIFGNCLRCGKIPNLSKNDIEYK
jgi:hypothetical protein